MQEYYSRLFFLYLFQEKIIKSNVLLQLKNNSKACDIIDTLRLHGIRTKRIIAAFKTFSTIQGLKINFQKPKPHDIKEPEFFELNAFMAGMKNGFTMNTKLGSKIIITKSINWALLHSQNIQIFYLEERAFIHFAQKIFKNHIIKYLSYNPFSKTKVLIPNVVFFILFHIFLLASKTMPYFYMIVASAKTILLLYGKIKKVKHKKSKIVIKDPKCPYLPRLTILIPLYKENKIINQLIDSINKINYPAALMDFKILVEERDVLTIKTLRRCRAKQRYHIIRVPESKIKTKPRALNYGILFSNGSYVTIFDAEDIPHPDQVLISMHTFEKYKHDPNLFATQSALAFYNDSSSIIAKMMNIEYNNLFCNLSPASAKYNCFVPLGGTSNYCDVQKLIRLQGWNSYNVTEDFDLSIEAFLNNQRIATTYSTTMESCVTGIPQWINQRTRWIKGFLISISSRFLYIHTTFIWHPAKLLSFYVLGWLNIAHPFFLLCILLNYKRNCNTFAITALILNSSIIVLLGSKEKFFSRIYHMIIYFVYNFVFIIPAIKAVLEIFYKYSFWHKTQQRVCYSDQGKKQTKAKGQ